jgi:hypothetical protein
MTSADGWRTLGYLRGMRYPDGGGLDAAERTRREQVRLALQTSALQSSFTHKLTSWRDAMAEKLRPWLPPERDEDVRRFRLTR